MDFKNVADRLCGKNYILFVQQSILLAAMCYCVISLGNLFDHLENKHNEFYKSSIAYLIEQVVEFKNKERNTVLQFWRLQLAHEFGDDNSAIESKGESGFFYKEQTNPLTSERFYEKETITPEPLLNLARVIEKCVPHYAEAFQLAQSEELLALAAPAGNYI